MRIIAAAIAVLLIVFFIAFSKVNLSAEALEADTCQLIEVTHNEEIIFKITCDGKIYGASNRYIGQLDEYEIQKLKEIFFDYGYPKLE